VNTGAEVGREDVAQALGFDLSDAQWNAVSAPLEPGVIVAGAGTGKTTSMSARVAYLATRGLVDADRVLGLTFTNKAAAQLLSATRSRIAAMGIDGAEPQVSTYNAFAARIVTDYGMRIGREPTATLLVDGLRHQHAYRLVCTADDESLVERLAGIGKSPAAITEQMLALDQELSELSIEPGELIEHDLALVEKLLELGAERGKGREISDAAHRRIALALLIGQWRDYKAARDLWDYSDQVRLAQQILDRYPETGEEIRSRFDIVLLDEYQDTSIAQRRLLQRLFAGGFPVTAVGDPCQAIYSWRGASVDNIESFPFHFPRASGDRSARYALVENRRSGPAVLHVANELASTLRAEHDGTEPLVAASDARPARVDVALFETIEQEVDYVTLAVRDAFERARASGATEPSQFATIAVLCTTAQDIRRIDRALRNLGVPTYVTGAAALLADPAVADTRALVEIVHEPTANPSMVRLLTGARWRVGARDLAVLGERARELAGGRGRPQGATIDEALDEAVAGSDVVEVVALADALTDPGPPERYSSQALSAFAEVAALIAELRSHTGEAITDFVARAIRELGVDVEAELNDPSGASAAALRDFLALAAGMTEIDGRVSLGGFITWLRDAERFNVTISHTRPRVDGAVQLMTVFAAKGLEFSHVFVPFVSDGAFPGGRSRGRWVTSSQIVPWPLRSDAPPELGQFPRDTGDSVSKQHDGYVDALRQIDERNNERLAYVALTRAESSLTVTGHWWGPGQTKPRGPHRFLEDIKKAVESADPDNCRVVVWADEPEPGSENPVAGSGNVAWPQPVPQDHRARLLAAAELIASQNGAGPSSFAPTLDFDTPEPSDPSDVSVRADAATDRIRRWHETYAALMEDRATESDEQVVRLGDHVGATTFLRALRNPEDVAVDLLRPMPRQPSQAAARGIAWHAWVETVFGQQSLLGVEDLPGAADEDIATDDQLEELKRAFERTDYAGRVPVAVERGFSVVVGGRVISGRIDAVFEKDGRFEVVDWKTGGTASVDTHQLAIYRLAWAQIAGVDWRDVDAVFVMVASGQELRPNTDAEVEALLDLG